MNNQIITTRHTDNLLPKSKSKKLVLMVLSTVIPPKTLGNEILIELTNSSIANVIIAKIIPARCTEKYPVIAANVRPASPPNKGKIGKGIYNKPPFTFNKIKPEK